MNAQNLISIIRGVTYLTDAQKQKWLQTIPQMKSEQLKQLSEIISWAERQRKNLTVEHDLVVSKFMQVFTGMNRYAVKRAKKETYKLAEKKEKSDDQKTIDSIFMKIEND